MIIFKIEKLDMFVQTEKENKMTDNRPTPTSMPNPAVSTEVKANKERAEAATATDNLIKELKAKVAKAEDEAKLLRKEVIAFKQAPKVSNEISKEDLIDLQAVAIKFYGPENEYLTKIEKMLARM